jgi:hypothetical protein
MATLKLLFCAKAITGQTNKNAIRIFLMGIILVQTYTSSYYAWDFNS